MILFNLFKTKKRVLHPLSLTTREKERMKREEISALSALKRGGKRKCERGVWCPGGGGREKGGLGWAWPHGWAGEEAENKGSDLRRRGKRKDEGKGKPSYSVESTEGVFVGSILRRRR